jgi:hypothetical protein
MLRCPLSGGSCNLVGDASPRKVNSPFCRGFRSVRLCGDSLACSGVEFPNSSEPGAPSARLCVSRSAGRCALRQPLRHVVPRHGLRPHEGRRKCAARERTSADSNLEGFLLAHSGTGGSSRQARAVTTWALAVRATPPNNCPGVRLVSEQYFVVGPEWLGPHNKHGALIAHALFGGVYAQFPDSDTYSGHGATGSTFYEQPGCPRCHHRRSHGPESLGPLGLPHHARRGDHALQYQRPPYSTPNVTHNSTSTSPSRVGIEYKFKNQR